MNDKLVCPTFTTFKPDKKYIDDQVLKMDGLSLKDNGIHGFVWNERGGGYSIGDLERMGVRRALTKLITGKFPRNERKKECDC